MNTVTPANPVLAPPTRADLVELVALKCVLFVVQAVLPLRAVLWLLDRVPRRRRANFSVVARKVSYVQGLKETRRYNRLVRLNCLKRSLITLYLLRRHGVPARFHLGVNPRRGKFAHAWVSSPNTDLVPILQKGEGFPALYPTLLSHG